VRLPTVVEVLPGHQRLGSSTVRPRFHRVEASVPLLLAVEVLLADSMVEGLPAVSTEAGGLSEEPGEAGEDAVSPGVGSTPLWRSLLVSISEFS
jgi:hypothetical protein